MLAKSISNKREHENLSESYKRYDRSEPAFNQWSDCAPQINKEIDLTTSKIFVGNQTSVIQRNIMSRAGARNHSREEGTTEVLDSQRSEQETYYGGVNDNQDNGGILLAVASNHGGGIKRRSYTGMLADNQSFARSYQPNPTADAYKTSQSHYPMDPRSVLYQYYNAKPVVDVNQLIIAKGIKKVNDTEHEIKKIKKCQLLSKSEERKSTKDDQEYDINPSSHNERN